MENNNNNVIFVAEIPKIEIMETLWTILWIVGVTIALILFYCGGWWPRTWFRGFLFTLLSFAFYAIEFRFPSYSYLSHPIRYMEVLQWWMVR